ncbi:MAG TPA: glycosyltransferase family 39 protein [Candidatus Hydrogenedentes bacterium]|nr:glycosyltransferase family 39 protein [Candidatus Hydrogenedentota bacterium]
MNPNATMRSRWRKIFPFSGMAACLVLAAWLRIKGLSLESAWCDEALTLLHFPATSLSDFLHSAFEEDTRLIVSPVYYVLEYGWFAMFGTSLVAIRMLSVTLGLMSIVLIFLVARRLYNATAGILAAFLLATSLVNVYYSQEVRFYALMGVFALLSMYALIRLLESGGFRWWVLHGICNAFMLWTHAFAPVFFLAQGVFLMAAHYRTPRRIVMWGLMHGLILILFAGWMKFLQYDFGTHSQAYSDAAPTFHTLANVMIVFAGGRFSNINPRPYMPWGISLDMVMAGMCAAAVAVALVLPWKRRASAPTRGACLLALCWWLVPILALYLIALLWRPCFFDRYVLYAALGLYILVAGAVSSLPSKSLRYMVMALFAAVYLYQSFALPRPFRPDYQSAARAIASDPNPHVAVHVLKLFNALGVRYSKPISEDRIVTFEGYPELCVETCRLAESGTCVWVVFYRWDRLREFEQQMHQARFSCECREFGGMPPLSACRVTRSPRP